MAVRRSVRTPLSPWTAPSTGRTRSESGGAQTGLHPGGSSPRPQHPWAIPACDRPRRHRGGRLPRPGVAARRTRGATRRRGVSADLRPPRLGAHNCQRVARPVQPSLEVRERSRARADRGRRRARVACRHGGLLRNGHARRRGVDGWVPALLLADRAVAEHRASSGASGSASGPPPIRCRLQVVPRSATARRRCCTARARPGCWWPGRRGATRLPGCARSGSSTTTRRWPGTSSPGFGCSAASRRSRRRSRQRVPRACSSRCRSASGRRHPTSRGRGAGEPARGPHRPPDDRPDRRQCRCLSHPSRPGRGPAPPPDRDASTPSTSTTSSATAPWSSRAAAGSIGSELARQVFASGPAASCWSTAPRARST